jgi:hypothetical protein
MGKVLFNLGIFAKVVKMKPAARLGKGYNRDLFIVLFDVLQHLDHLRWVNFCLRVSPPSFPWVW